jgi:hypothetical protein
MDSPAFDSLAKKSFLGGVSCISIGLA